MAVSVKIGDFRDKLSAYLRKVRRGFEVIITDRNTPIGKIVPMTDKNAKDFPRLVPALRGSEGLARLKFSRSDCTADPVDFLLMERNRR